MGDRRKKSVNEEFLINIIIPHQNNLFIHKKAFACKQGERQYKTCLLGFTWKLSPKTLKQNLVKSFNLCIDHGHTQNPLKISPYSKE
jgi:hypothetical protein